MSAALLSGALLAGCGPAGGSDAGGADGGAGAGDGGAVAAPDATLGPRDGDPSLQDAAAELLDASGARDVGSGPEAGVGADAGPTWSSCPRLPGGPRQETAVVALAGELYVLGGFDGASQVVSAVEIYSPSTGAWRAGPSLPVPLHHAQAAVVGDRILILGFLTGLDFRADGRGFALQRGAASWTAVAPLPAGTERGGGATAVIGDQVYVVGGLRGGAVTDVTVYDDSRDAHASAPALPERRDHLGAIGLGDRVYVIGGRTARIESHQPDTWILDPGAITWRSARPMPTSRGGFALAAVGDRIVVLGGEGDVGAASGVFAAVESYRGSTDTWSMAAPMPEPRHGTGAATIDGLVYVPGGADRQGFGAVATCVVYRP